MILGAGGMPIAILYATETCELLDGLMLVAGLFAAPNLRAAVFPMLSSTMSRQRGSGRGGGCGNCGRGIVQGWSLRCMSVEGVANSTDLQVGRDGPRSIPVGGLMPGWTWAPRRRGCEFVDQITTLPGEAEEPRVQAAGSGATVSPMVVHRPVVWITGGALRRVVIRAFFAEGITRTTVQGVHHPKRWWSHRHLMAYEITLPRDAAAVNRSRSDSRSVGDVRGPIARVRTGSGRSSDRDRPDRTCL